MLYVAVWLLCAVIAAVVGSGRGEPARKWAMLGLLLGPIGAVVAFTAGSRCPSCKSRIHAEATVCPKCQAAVTHKPSVPEAEPELDAEAPTGWAPSLRLVVLVTVALLALFTVFGVLEQGKRPPGPPVRTEAAR